MPKNGMCMSRPFVNIETSWIQFWKRERKIQRLKTRTVRPCAFIQLFSHSLGPGRISEHRLLQSKATAGPRNWTPTLSWLKQTKSDELEKGLKDRYFTKDFQLRDGMDECRAYFRYETFQGHFSRSTTRVRAGSIGRMNLSNRCSLLDRQFHPSRDLLLLLAPGTDHVDFHCRPSPWVDLPGVPFFLHRGRPRLEAPAPQPDLSPMSFASFFLFSRSENSARSSS